ncbi:MAG: GNAT family N-acetyltransferase [Patescibacteria group bacterium]
MGKEEIRIDRSTPEDARGITEVFYRAWLNTYPNEEHGITVDDVEDKFKDSFTEEAIVKREEAIRNVKDNEKRFTLKDGERVVGAIQVVIKSDRNVLGAIYILPEYQRTGLGLLLWEEAKKNLDPKKRTTVEVASYNTKAINFYKKLGFRETGKVRYDDKYKVKSGNIIPTTELVMSASAWSRCCGIIKFIRRSF